ncbi:MAG: FG-GAP repeat domain-containing protein [Bacteroidota bacterium]
MKRLLFLQLVLTLLFWQCQTDNASQKESSSSESIIKKPETSIGGQLAMKYCSSCHLFPTPDLLDKVTWTESVLPNMAARLGLRLNDYDPFEEIDLEEEVFLKKFNVYPEQAVINESEWNEIQAFYQTMAPEKLEEVDHSNALSNGPPPFQAEILKIGDKPVPQVSLLEYNTTKRTLFIGDHQQLYALNQNSQVIGNWETQSPSSDIEITNDGIMVLSIGEFKPSDKREGVLFPLTLTSDISPEDLVITDLQRPVQFTVGDLNNDNQDDVVICSFGNHQGQLAWYDNFNKQEAHILSSLPGARKAIIQDLNGDGLKDIIALMAQACEKLVVYYNQGDGQFKETTLLELPSVYGVSYFELADFNLDGHPDILLTNGDNWDYSNIPKPYHGIRIYLNDGSNQFSLRYFYPLHGCNEARAIDFDKDGDLDIASISFYNDNATEGFVYLQNDGQLNFTDHYMTEAAYGKWLTMDIGDFNNDGFQDIFLGSYFHNAAELSKLIAIGIDTFPEILLLTYSENKIQ